MNQKNEGLRGSLLTFCKGMVVGGTMLVPGGQRRFDGDDPGSLRPAGQLGQFLL